ncbi:MAG: phenylalanine--tRNA ligase subunit alpha [Solirubrobacterales bacterium]
MDELENILAEAMTSVAEASSLDQLEAARVAALGKKGSISGLMAGLGKMDPEERKAAGARLNTLKDQVAEAIAARKAELEARALDERLARERVDVTLPVRPESQGRVHPISQVMEEMTAIFAQMGFEVAEGPDIEDDFHNFTALNIPAEHPARQMHDTFYFGEREDGTRHLLRTHTSPVQIRTMLSEKPPIRIIAPGRTYRCDSDMTHTPMFHQIEGLVIDRATHMGHLKGTLIEFVRTFFEVDDVPVRFRPSFFPFTEPSAEIDIGCSREGGELKIGRARSAQSENEGGPPPAGGGWLEIGGSGMVHPNVLKACGLDPDEWQGFAFGMGVERMAMLKYGIPDLRTFFDSDIRWLKHYGFAAQDVPTLSGGLTR